MHGCRCGDDLDVCKGEEGLGEEGQFDGGNTAAHSYQYLGSSIISGVSIMTHYMSIFGLL